FLIVTALVITAILVAALEYTRFGAQVRAAVDNPRMARGLGVDVDRAFAITFALGGGLAGLGGALAIEIVGLDHAFAFTYLVYVLIVVAVGGLGSIGGSFVAAPAYLQLASQIAITALFALSLDLILGYAGIVSLGHAAFFGLGAYAAGLLSKHAWGEPLSGLLIASAVSAAVGYAMSFII